MTKIIVFWEMTVDDLYRVVYVFRCCMYPYLGGRGNLYHENGSRNGRVGTDRRTPPQYTRVGRVVRESRTCYQYIGSTPKT